MDGGQKLLLSDDKMTLAAASIYDTMAPVVCTVVVGRRATHASPVAVRGDGVTVSLTEVGEALQSPFGTLRRINQAKTTPLVLV